MRARSAVPLLIGLLSLAVLSASCTSRADVRQALEVADTAGGWYDAGIVDGKNKIVPTVTFRLRKKEDANISAVSLNVAFRHPAAEGSTTEDEWDEVFLQNVQFTEGSQTAPLTVRAEKGYTGDPPQSRADLLQHSEFRDVRARVFAKSSGGQWVDLAVIDVPRQLLTR
jgi:hypothetical protein